jgi:methanethiol S-methyltransferase
MMRVLYLAYGLVAYAAFVGTIVYSVGFVTGLFVSKTIDSGPATPLPRALAIDLALLLLFALQHSVMARKSFKAWWLRFIPAPIERSTYVLVASLTLALLFWQWRPIPAVVWRIDDPFIGAALLEFCLFGFAIVVFSTFLFNHFEQYGVRQVAFYMMERNIEEPQFRTPSLYKMVRHPIYVGFTIAFWATPVMTAGHLLFAAVTTGYIFIGIALEERDLVAAFGDEYRRYRERVGVLPLPRFSWRAPSAPADVAPERNATQIKKAA